MDERKVTLITDFHYFQLKHYPKEDAFCSKVNGEWVRTSSQEFIDQANRLSLGLIQKGIRPGDKVAILANNRTEWHLADLAVLQTGAVLVPIYPTITEEDYEYILNDAQAKLIFISDQELLQKVTNIRSRVPSLQDIYTFNEIPGTPHWTTLLAPSGSDTKEIEEIRSTMKETDLATLIYTSGTTGVPKGVMLTHKNLVSNVQGSEPRFPCSSDSRALSFLPLCHVYERMVTYLYIYKGVSIYYAESMETIGENMKEVRPEVFTAVPRLLEKIYDKIVAKGKELKGVKKALFFWALNLGLRYEPNGGNGWWYETQLKLANKLIFSKWREALGGRAKIAASGSAALQPRLARIFLAARIPVMEGYGLTETSPVIAVNCETDGGVMIGSVGKPLANVKVRIAEDGEIQVKGPNVMIGYYNKPEETIQTFTEDGWLKTGDIGELTLDGYLKITDRKKEIFKTSGGKYIAPQVMENKFKESPFIEQIMVIGESQKHPAAIVQPAFEFLEKWCKKEKLPCKDRKEMVSNEKVKEKFAQEVEKYNTFFAQYEKIKKFELCPENWTIEGGEITPTLKLKRKAILSKYKELYNRIYPA